MKCLGMSFRQHAESSVLGTLAGQTGSREFEPRKCMSENSAPFVQLTISEYRHLGAAE